MGIDTIRSRQWRTHGESLCGLYRLSHLDINLGYTAKCYDTAIKEMTGKS